MNEKIDGFKEFGCNHVFTCATAVFSNAAGITSVAKLDRLGRDAQDGGATVKLLATRKISVIVLQLDKLDLTSAAGKMMLTMLAAVAEMERDLLVERTQAGLARAKSEGKILGRPSKTTVAQRADIIARYKGGESVSALARQFLISRASILGVVKSDESDEP